MNVTIGQAAEQLVKQQLLLSTEPNVLAVSSMALICSRSNDESCAWLRALTADNDKCDSCSIDMACDVHVRMIYIFFNT